MRWREISSEPVPARNASISAPEPFWLISQFSTKELEGKRVWINWFRNGINEACGIYIMRTGAYGHSRHIQSIRAVPLDAPETDDPPVDFDQADADQLHRTNEKPEDYSFVADLDMDRVRSQSPNLAKLVQERRTRKREDEAGGAHLPRLKSH